MSFDEYRKEASPDRKEVRVCFDRQLLADLESAQRDLSEARQTAGGEGEIGLGESELVEAEERVKELRAQVKEKMRPLVFQSLGRARWRDLLSEHPPTEQQKKELFLDHNPETFVPVAMAESCVEPGMKVEDAQWFVDEFPLGVVNRVVDAMLSVNVTGAADPFDEDSASPRPSGRK